MKKRSSLLFAGLGSSAVVSALVMLAFSSQAVRVPIPAGPSLEVSAGHFPHGALKRELIRVVDAEGRVDYKALASDRAGLERYLNAVAAFSPKDRPDLFPTPDDALAYWINAYNAYVLFAVTERKEMRSVGDEKVNFFALTRYRFGQESRSLYSIENDIIRKEFDDPRIHMALNCASLGCPDLPAEAFEPQRLDAQLSREARLFCADAEKIRVAEGGVEASELFSWYAEDFEADGGAVGFCRRWGRTDLPEGADARFIPWDWSLNAQRGRALADPAGAGAGAGVAM